MAWRVIKENIDIFKKQKKTKKNSGRKFNQILKRFKRFILLNSIDELDKQIKKIKQKVPSVDRWVAWQAIDEDVANRRMQLSKPLLRPLD